MASKSGKEASRRCVCRCCSICAPILLNAPLNRSAMIIGAWSGFLPLCQRKPMSDDSLKASRISRRVNGRAASAWAMRWNACGAVRRIRPSGVIERRSLAALFLALPVAAQAQGADPLPSWREGPRKRALLDFVASVTREGSAGYVPPTERIGV